MIRRRVRGFSLLEVVLAIGLIALLLGSASSFLWDLLDRRTRLGQAAAELESGGALIERLEQDLLATMVGGAPPAGPGAGVHGEETSIRLLTRGVWIELAPATAAGKHAAPAAGDVQVSEYTFDAGSGQIRASRGATGAGAVAPAADVIASRVARLRLRYYDGRDWQPRFDSVDAGALPVAVEVAIWFGDPTPDATSDGGEAHVGAAAAPKTWGQPDRLRVIVVPDGPVSAWKEGA